MLNAITAAPPQYGQVAALANRLMPITGPIIRATAAMPCPTPRMPPCSVAPLRRDKSDCSEGVTHANPTTQTGMTA